MKKRKNLWSSAFITISFLLVLLGSPAHAAWFSGHVKQVVPRGDSGDVYIQLIPSEGEGRYSGVVRGVLLGSEPGTNKIMAALLASVALKSRISFEMANTPSWETPQVMSAVGLVAQ